MGRVRRAKVRGSRGIVGTRRVEHDQLQTTGHNTVGIRELLTAWLVRVRIEETEPAVKRLIAILVIPTDEDPRRNVQQRLCGRKEIRIPYVPAEPKGTPGATRVTYRAGNFAIVKIAHVNNEIGESEGRSKGVQTRGPRVWIVAGLKRVPCPHPAAGVAPHNQLRRVPVPESQLVCLVGPPTCPTP